jgi:hypothetical protein
VLDPGLHDGPVPGYERDIAVGEVKDNRALQTAKALLVSV